jgi:hypothetical protein
LKFKDNIGKVKRLPYTKENMIHSEEWTWRFADLLISFQKNALQFSPSQVDVHCFLLTDILLVCKQTAKRGHGNLKVRIFDFLTWIGFRHAQKEKKKVSP